MSSAVILALAGPQQEMEQIHVEVFHNVLSTHLKKILRPPTGADLGTKTRKTKPFPTTRTVVDSMLSVAKGMPPEDEALGILRMTPGGVIKPLKSTSAGDTIKVKLQDPDHIASFYSLHEKFPTRGEGAAMLSLPKSKEKRDLKGQAVVMASGPARMRAFIPKNKAATLRFASMRLSHQLTYMDENADVTYSTGYPPWMKQRLRAEIYSAFIKMGQRHLPVCPIQYALVSSRLADPYFTGRWAKVSSPLPPPPSTQPKPPSGVKRRKSTELSPATTKKAKKARLTEKSYDVERIVEESGPWGGHSRWFAVQWAHEGYEPSWEAWRNAGGLPGTPVVRLHRRRHRCHCRPHRLPSPLLALPTAHPRHRPWVCCFDSRALD